MSTRKIDKPSTVTRTNSKGREELHLKGISASPGIVIGRIFLKGFEVLTVPVFKIPANKVQIEIEKFNSALQQTRKELIELKSRLAASMGEDHAKIFDAHMMILSDTLAIDDTVKMIESEKKNAAAAFQSVLISIVSSFKNIEDEYLKDRYTDIMDVKRRVLRKLLGKDKRSFEKPAEPSVIVAHDLSPGDTAQFERDLTLGYATDVGGRTSHTAILARSQGIPAVVGLERLSSVVENGDTLIIDGNCGMVVLNPSKATLALYRKEIERFGKLEEQLLTLTGYPAVTLDKRKIVLAANIDMPQELESVREHGGQGIGLFRTEYFFIAQEHLPTEEEQYRLYKQVLEEMDGKFVIIRTLDIGGDKIVRYLHNSAELNPFMGWRGIRFCLARKDIFKTQLRAIYRASTYGKVKIMFPMISQVEEVLRAKEICAEVRGELKRDRFKIDEEVPIGIMVETPSAVAAAEMLAKEAAFFSIGTNDLIQYTLAVDRGNSKISNLYQNLHPSIIRFIKSTVDEAHKRKIPVGICGEMCADPLSIVVLIGLQLDEFSCSPYVIPEAKKIIRSVTFDECKSLVKRLLQYSLVSEIEKCARDFLLARCPDLSIFQDEQKL